MLLSTLLLTTSLFGAPPPPLIPELVLDEDVIAHGDVFYVELRVSNRSRNRNVSLPSVSMSTKLPSEKTYRGVLYASENIRGEVPVFPNQHSEPVIVAQVVPFSFDYFANPTQDTYAVLHAQLGLSGFGSARKAIAGIGIDGTLVMGESTALRTLYASWNLRTPPSEYSQIPVRSVQLHDLGIKEAAWNAGDPEQIARLLRELSDGSAIYRLVKITQLANRCLESATAGKSKAVAQLVEQLTSCGTAERKWFTRRLLGEFQRCHDLTSRQLFLAATPREDRETPATGELSLEVNFDRHQIRRGEPAYCEVRLHNYGLEPRIVDDFSRDGFTHGHRVMLFGEGVDLAAATLHDTQGGGGAMVGGGTKKVELPPNAAMVTCVQVCPFSYTNHDSPIGKLSHAIAAVWTTMGFSASYRIDIEGDISARAKRDVVRELYVDFENHPSHDPHGALPGRGFPQIKNFLNNETPWPLSFPPNIDRLLQDLVPNTATWRIVSVVKWSHGYLATKDSVERRDCLTELRALLSGAGSSERRWITWRLYQSFGDQFPRAHRTDFLQSFPEAENKTKVIAPRDSSITNK